MKLRNGTLLTTTVQFFFVFASPSGAASHLGQRLTHYFSKILLVSQCAAHLRLLQHLQIARAPATMSHRCFGFKPRALLVHRLLACGFPILSIDRLRIIFGAC